jgi:hypothetical protein
MDNLVVFARLWQDNSGNTYHTAEVFCDGDYMPGGGEITYGYGRHYLHTAMSILNSNGLVEDNETRSITHWCNDRGIKFCDSAANVARKADL